MTADAGFPLTTEGHDHNTPTQTASEVFGAGFNIDEQDSTGHSALHFACGYGEVEIVKVLLSSKASVTGAISWLYFCFVV